MNSTHKAQIFLAGAAATTLVLSACSGPDAPTSAEAQSTVSSKTMTVLASFYPLQFLAEEIGGDLVTVDSLTPPGGEPHDLQLSPQKVAEIGSADAIVYLSGFQSAVDEAVEHSAPENVIDVAPAVQLLESEGHNEDPHDGQSGTKESDHNHGREGQSGDQETGHHQGHDHDGVDPHFWLDPMRMSQAATSIGQAFAKADPANAQTYTTNAATVAKSMEDLSNELVEGTKNCKRTTFVTTHEAFGYLADRTGLKQVGIAGIDPEAAPTPARLAEISEIVKSQDVNTIFTEALLDPKVAETLAQDLGIKTDVLDPLESLSDESSDYTTIMKANIAALRTALDCT